MLPGRVREGKCEARLVILSEAEESLTGPRSDRPRSRETPRRTSSG